MKIKEITETGITGAGSVATVTAGGPVISRNSPGTNGLDAGNNLLGGGSNKKKSSKTKKKK